MTESTHKTAKDQVHKEEEERFLRFVNKTDSCWAWTGWSSKGYGLFKFRTRAYKAHRFSYELYIGPIPEGLVIDHLCRNRWCVRPDHLEPVTNKENCVRGEVGQHYPKGPGKTHCVNGHEYTEENTYRPPSGQKVCRICKNERSRRAREDARRLQQA